MANNCRFQAVKQVRSVCMMLRRNVSMEVAKKPVRRALALLARPMFTLRIALSDYTDVSF